MESTNLFYYFLLGNFKISLCWYPAFFNDPEFCPINWLYFGIFLAVKTKILYILNKFFSLS